MKTFLLQRKWTICLIAAIALLCVAGTKVSRLTRTRTIQSNSRFYVVTQDVSGRFYSRYIEASELATNLSQWNTNGGTGVGEVTTAQLTVVSNQSVTASNKFQTDVSNLQGATNGINTRLSNLQGATNGLDSALTSLTSRALTNSDTRIISFTTNLTVLGKTTNANDLAVNGGDFTVNGTNGTTSIYAQEYGSSWPQILQQNANGTESSPTAIASGDLVGQLGISGRGDTIYKTAFSIRPSATTTFGDSASSTLVRFGVGDAVGTSLGRPVWYLTAYNFTNDANMVIKSNLAVNGLETIDGSLTVSGAVAAQSTVTATGLLTANTNNFVLGTNRARWLKLDGGQTASAFAIIDGDTNVVGWISTNSFPSQTQLNTASNAVYALETTRNAAVSNGAVSFTMTASNNLYATETTRNAAVSNALTALLVANDTTTSNGLSTRIDAKLSVIETMTNGVRVRLTTNVNLIAGPSITILATNNASANRTDYFIDAPASALADGDKTDITVSSSGAVWTIDDDAVTDAKIRESAGFSVIGKSTTGTGNPADITAGTDTVLGRNGSGNLTFASLATSQIANDAVTYAKMQNISSTDRILGRDSVGAGDTEELTLSQVLDFIGSAAQGDVLYRGAAGWERLGAGTSGQVLTTSGAGANPTWSTPSSGGTTNPAAFAAGSIYLTNSIQEVGRSLFLRTTNMWADGGMSQLYSNVFAANAGGLTNILATNILDGQSLDIWFFPSNGVNVGFPQFADSDYLEGSFSPQTNRWNLARISRRNTTTNIWLVSKGYELAAGAGITFSTNHPSATIGVRIADSPTITNSVILVPSSGSTTVIKAAASSASVTNLTGILHKLSTSPVELDANAASKFSVTNRITAATTLIFTNTSDGQEISVTLLGEISGGTSRTVTLIPQLGHLVADLDTFGTALATSSSLTLTNGNAVEISWKVSRLNGTNIAAKVSRQFSF